GNENLFSLPSKQVNYPVLTQRSEGNENLFSLPSKQVNYPVLTQRSEGPAKRDRASKLNTLWSCYSGLPNCCA
ncbi:MAG: hypothetical protein ABH832_03940, partial [bacterium]